MTADQTRPAAGYYRVSSDSQTRGNSPEMQRTEIERYAELYHYAIPSEAWFSDDGVSGRKASRPGLEAAVTWCVHHKAVLICWDLDRYMRNTLAGLDIELRLRRAGAGLASVNQRIDTTTPEGVLMFTFFLGIAQYESDKISRRTTHCMAVCKSNGRIVSGDAPYGWARDMSRPETHRVRQTTYYPHLIEVPEEQAVLMGIRTMYQQGLSLSEIARRLTARGVLTRTGNVWAAEQVRRAIKGAAPTAMAETMQ